jgi:hypothetical protein
MRIDGAHALSDFMASSAPQSKWQPYLNAGFDSSTSLENVLSTYTK